MDYNFKVLMYYKNLMCYKVLTYCKVLRKVVHREE